MPLQIITEVPRRPWGRRILRGVAVLTGVLLLVVALVAGAVTIVLLALFVLMAGDNGVEAEAFVVPVVGVVVAVVGMLVALRLLRGRRRLVLFLRRFGLAEATEAVTFAVTSAMGGAWRVVTLDDAEITPVGVSVRTRRSLALAAVIGVAVLGAGLTWFFASGGLDGIVDSAMAEAMDRVDTSTEEGAGFGEALAALFAGIITVMIVGLVVGLAMLVLVALALMVTVFFGVAGLFTASAYVRARRAERRKRAVITSHTELEEVTRELGQRSRRIMGSRLTVLTVAHAIWQDAVRALAEVAPVVLVDVSEPSENLLWELKILQRDRRTRRVLIGDESRLVALVARQQGAEGDDPHLHQLAALLDGEKVFAYGSGRRSMRRFARALRVRLEVAG